MASLPTRVRLRIAPGASRTGFAGRHGEAWKVRVAAAAESGKANEAVLRLLAERLELPRRSVALVSGHSGRDKLVELHGIEAAEAARRLDSAGRGR